eukprot:TRINITY_DN2458_c0_g1_i1.p1 TRINITY_DN2458_c0_g1~~TRINITY_DN2458_c0_g1_i1.p1  ORF type:complete len:315 (+),score=35.87 TRINITY_DN2458_c0_g1_i1:344-1288(+)
MHHGSQLNLVFDLMSSKVAAKVRAPERGVKIMLDFLVTLDLISVTKNQFALLPCARDYLVPTSPAYMGGMISLYTNEIYHKRYLKLPEAIQAGRQVFQKDTAETRQHPYWNDFASTTKEMSIRPAQKMADILKPFVKRKNSWRVLDLACGSGVYGYTVASAFPNADLTLFDQANVIPIAKKWLSDFPQVSADRVAFVEGDAFSVQFEGFDVIILSHFYNHFSMDVNNRFTINVHKWLKPGGIVIVNAFLKEGEHPSFLTNPFSWEFSVLSFTWTDSGDSFYFEDYRQMFRAASFSQVSLIRNHPFPNSFIVAIK